jgi:hypothetical protein
MRTPDFRQWVKRKLGEGECGVAVELSDDQIDQCLDDAKEWFGAKHGLYKEAYIDLVDGEVEYDLSGVTPGIEQIVDVVFPKEISMIDFSKMYPGFYDINGVPYGSSSYWQGQYPHTTITQTLQTLSSATRLFNAELTWEFYKDSSDVDNPVVMLRILPKPSAGRALYTYKINPTEVTIESYTAQHLYLVKQYALAEAKYTLGRIRGKYQSLPAAGSERTLDGDSLIQESVQDKERLNQEILQLQGPVLPVVG